MDELIPNADRCEKFLPNPFKKEKCKHCSRPWNEHLGVISEDIVRGFVEARQKIIDDKQRAEAEAKAKVRARAVAKKKAQQAVEDEWFFEGTDDKTAMDADSDDDLGFRMFSGENLESTPVSQTNSIKPLKVVNLIDFHALQEEEEELAAAERAAYEDAQRRTVQSTVAVVEAAGPAGVPMGSPLDSGGGIRGNDHVPDPTVSLSQPIGAQFEAQEDVHSLVSEIEYLRQMLSNAKEEATIQVEIVRDDVAEKQKIIEELRREMASIQEQTRTACSNSNSENEALRAELSRQRDGSERLQKEMLAELEQLRDENRQLHAEVLEARSVTNAMNDAAKDTVMASNNAFFASLVSELVSSSLRMRRVVANEKADGQEDGADVCAETAVCCCGDLESDLRCLKEANERVELGVNDLAADRRKLTLKVGDLERKLAVQSANNLSPASSKHIKMPVSPTGEAVGKHASVALREIRLNAQEHLAWIRTRAKKSTDHHVGGRLGMPEIDAFGGGC